MPSFKRRPSGGVAKGAADASGQLLRGSHLDKEAVELPGQIARLCRQMLRGAQNLLGGSPGIVGGALHAGDVGIDLLGAVRGFLDAAGDFLGRGALFFDRGRNCGADLIDLCDDVSDVGGLADARRRRTEARRLHCVGR